MEMRIDEMRRYVKRAVDKFDDATVKKYYRQILIDTIPEEDETITEDEWKRIEAAKKRLDDGEYVDLETFLSEIDGDSNV
jgi:hypothetical protein